MELKRKGHHHRRNHEGVMCEVIKYTWTCCGCTCDVMGHDTKGIPLGMGCHECGYTGKRRNIFYLPLNFNQNLNQGENIRCRSVKPTTT